MPAKKSMRTRAEASERNTQAKRSSAATVDLHENAYEAFVRDLKLIGLGLDSSSSYLNREAYSDTKKSEMVRRLSAKYTVLEVGGNAEHSFFESSGEFKLSVVDESKEGAPLLTVHATFSAHFHFQRKSPKEFITRFTESEFRLVLWPYFRQLVTDMTARMAVAPIIVPLNTPDEWK